VRLLVPLILINFLLSAAGQLVISERDRFLSSLPLWNGESSFRPASYVYRTSDPNSFVISYPANLEQKGRESDLIVDRFRLQNENDPSVYSNISAGNSQAFVYTYTVQNGVGAREAIWAWSLIHPGEDNSLSIQSAGWNCYQVTGMPAGEHQVIPGMELGLPISCNNVKKPIGPGERHVGFQIKSESLPGLTTAFFISGHAISVTEELPLAVSNQLAPFFRREITNQPRLTIAPRFPPSTSRPQWAAGFARDLRAALTVSPDLNRSQFVPQLLAFLDICAKGECPQPPKARGTVVLPLEEELADLAILMSRR